VSVLANMEGVVDGCEFWYSGQTCDTETSRCAVSAAFRITDRLRLRMDPLC